MCLWGKREKSFICILIAFSQKIWREENMIINKLCGGVEIVCICVYTPDDAPFKATHCVLGLDHNGKVGAYEWNHLQIVDQFLISSVCYEKNQLSIQNSNLINTFNFQSCRGKVKNPNPSNKSNNENFRHFRGWDSESKWYHWICMHINNN